MVETERLLLRPFRDADREAFAAINADPRVNHWFGGPVDRPASDASLDQANAHIARHGYGLWAAEHKPDRRLVGMIGLNRIEAGPPLGPIVEAGWHLSPDYWGQGLAVEGARAAIGWGLARLDVAEIIATTALANLRSQGVMHRAGMVPQPQRAFVDPQFPEDHALRWRVVYAIAASVGRPRAPAASAVARFS